MLIRTLGTWQIVGNNCTATLDFDWGRSVNISLRWSREPGPIEHEHLALILPDVVRSAVHVVEEGAALCERVLDMIADGRICRSGIEDDVFTYEAIDKDRRHDALLSEEDV